MGTKTQRSSAGGRHLRLVSDRTNEARPIDFFFYGDAEYIATLSDVLVQRGFAVRAAESGLVATIALRDEPAAFRKTANWLASVAGDLGLEFDGWESRGEPTAH